jgi:alkylation response protein AidB-like acyl-CoA dehydrogenase
MTSTMAADYRGQRMDAGTVLERVRAISDRFAADRHDRQRRDGLVPGEFEELAEAGFLLTGVPSADGGLFESVAASTRTIGGLLNVLARGDASVALVASMHPAVLSFWHASPEAPEPYREAWDEQRGDVSRMAREGCWFGTITSEPGSGGDVARTTASAEPRHDGDWRLTGKKHFGSGSGITSYMLTSARPAREEEPDWFLLDVRDVPWDGSRGIKLIAPWDGHGMTATQSHGMAFESFAATRFAWPGSWRQIADAAAPFVATTFTAVILGVVEQAIASAREQLAGRADSLRAYEQVEWANAEQDAWLMRQAYEGMLRAVETQPEPLPEVLLGKTAAARLSEDCLRRLTRVLGGGTFARHSPYGFWFEDVRALGYLRPPWGLAYDALIESARRASDT